jgi:CMP-N-acetylneuraminic acid synthetase/spore coat polysaccharide biosynthesis predicted glycosyltransferase SpsG
LKSIAIIPARGGSKGIPRKSIRPLAGKPMIYYAIQACRACTLLDAVYVSTDDPEIAMLAGRFGAKVIQRPAELANDAATLDPVVAHAVCAVEEVEGWRSEVVVTVQPTSPLVLPTDIEDAIRRFENPAVDTVLSVVDDRHLCWTMVDGRPEPTYERRVNRQSLPSNFRETGAVIACTRSQIESGTRIGRRVELLEIPQLRSFDIDSIADLYLCESMLRRRRVVFTIIGYPEVGLGHVYRALMLAHELVAYDIHFVCESSSQMGADIIAGQNYPVQVCPDGDLQQTVLTLAPDLVINDILDTDAAYVAALQQQGARVVNFEDLGSGGDTADLVVNALYAPHKQLSPKVLVGAGYFCLRDEFLYLPKQPPRSTVRRVLITFGGVDEGDITSRVLATIAPFCEQQEIAIDVVVGPGYRYHERLQEQLCVLDGAAIEYTRATKRISDHMLAADLAITSGGRTVLELAALQIPTLVICQNQRETTHEFAKSENGILNFGLWSNLDFEKFAGEFQRIILSSEARNEMRAKAASMDLRKGKKRVIDAIIDLSTGENES